MTKRRLAGGIAAVATGVTLVLVPGVASAKIAPVDVSCTNPGGNQPGGQQPTCTGGGQTQQSENQNPSGAAPPGQNP